MKVVNNHLVGSPRFVSLWRRITTTTRTRNVEWQNSTSPPWRLLEWRSHGATHFLQQQQQWEVWPDSSGYAQERQSIGMHRDCQCTSLIAQRRSEWLDNNNNIIY